MIKRTVIVRPVGHFLHGFHFRTTSFGDVGPIVALFHPTYVPGMRIPFGGMPEDHWGYGLDWSVSDPDIGRKLIDGLGGDVLDSLLRIDTPDKFLVWADHLSYTQELPMFTHALAGRRARAVELAKRRVRDLRDLGLAEDPRFRKHIRRLHRLIRIFESGQARTNRMLRTFERVNARNIGVEPWWCWSPVVE